MDKVNQFVSGSASQNINSQVISANYVPPTNTRPTFAPATFAPVTRPIQPAAPLIPAPRPPQVQPLQLALPTLPATNPVALPAINRPVFQPINTDPNNMLLMPLQPTGLMPTISNLDVQCGKESMVVTVVFTQVFSGVIYAKVSFVPHIDVFIYNRLKNEKVIVFSNVSSNVFHATNKNLQRHLKRENLIV